MTIETVCNQALDEIGYARHIGNIYEGTKAARAFLNTWVQTRDALLEKVKPDWACRDAVLVLLRQAPNIVNGTANYDQGWNDNYPPIPWLYEYEYPADCIAPLQVKQPPLFLPVWRPRFNSMRLTYETTGMKRSILTNTPAALVIYTAVVPDPNDWQKDFTELVIMTLAKKIEPELMPARAAARRQQEQQQSQQDASNSAS